MYEAFYGFTEKPFNLTPDPDFLYLSPGHEQVQSYLQYGLESGEGFIQVTGEIGSGKTTLVRNLLRGLHPGLKVAHVVNPRGTFRQLLRLILDDLDVVSIDEDLPRERLLAAFERFVEERAVRGLPVVIIFDEAQNLDPNALEEIRMLSNIEGEKQKLVQIILIGQPELRELLASPELEQLAQRIAVRCHLSPLTEDQTRLYIEHRIRIAGGDRKKVRFKPDACRAVHELSGGVPRRINIVCNATLLAGFVDERHTFHGAYVRSAVADLRGSDELGSQVAELAEPAGGRSTASWRPGAGLLVGGSVALLLVGVGAWLAFGDGMNTVRPAVQAVSGWLQKAF
jgi:general secretion pathway protein A